MSGPQESLLQPEERVLSTLEHDGKRRWLFPRLSTGRFWHRRRVVAYALIAFFTVLPWTSMNGKPTVLLDILHREFTFFGRTFLATDTLLLALLVVGSFLSIFLITAVFGRVWCGWACPQTVYLEYVYRPIERLFTGKTGKGGKPKNVPVWRRIAMYVVFLLISVHLANTALAYFVGVENLNKWIWTSPPWEHPIAVLVVLIVTAWMMFDLCYWREQMCIIGCPYGRFQSVMLDRNSLIVSYDHRRGEPRGRAKKPKGGDVALPQLGDCVDCTMCVQVCPTGIDIRDGLQMECVNCTQCIDACDSVMDKLGRARGLIRYSSQAAIDGEKPRLLRPRLVLYPLVILVVASAFVYVLLNSPSTDVTVLRAGGRAYVVTDAGEVDNTMRVKLVNRTDAARTYTFAVVGADGQPAENAGLRARASSETVTVGPGEMWTEPVHVFVDPDALHIGELDVRLRVTDDLGETVEKGFTLLGPRRAIQPAGGVEDDDA